MIFKTTTDYSLNYINYIAKKNEMSGKLYRALGVNPSKVEELKEVSKKLDIPVSKLNFYDDKNILPFNDDLVKIEKVFRIPPQSLKLKMGIIDHSLKKQIQINADKIAEILEISNTIQAKIKQELIPEFTTDLGKMYRGDCLDLLRQTPDNEFDLIFADPPFNLDKFYLSKINDNLSQNEYLSWCETWLEQCVRVLKPGGSLFLWNIPKWNTFLSEFLNNRLLFRHWISADIKYSLPITGKLYPSHYSLLYYSKGKPKTFKPDRMPMEVCKKCLSELKDYGGYKNKMNPKGINLTDIWYDIPPVRHNKYKRRKEANELSIKLMDRIIEMSSEPNDKIFDPFGGSGTTYIVAEIKKRQWVGIELGPINDILDRFNLIFEEEVLMNKYRENYNSLFPTKIKSRRMQLNLWTDDTFIHNNGQT